MIFIVEDNAGIRDTVKAYLELAGYGVKEFEGVSGVAEALEYVRPELCILDVMLPDGNGFSLAKRIRESHPDVPFLFLTARESEGERITGLELGAEDYVVKPFSPRELVLRVKAILRRSGSEHADPRGEKVYGLGSGRLVVKPESHELRVDGVPVRLTAVEWNILTFLADNARILVPRERILGECLNYTHDGSERTVNTHVKNIRSKLGSGEWIETVRGFGYKFAGKEIADSGEPSVDNLAGVDAKKGPSLNGRER